MATGFSEYLSDVQSNLNLDVREEREVIRELLAHLEDRSHELVANGLSETEATKNCLDMLGSARKLAREIYQSHSRANWRQTLLAASPHFIFGAVFALNWWQHVLGMFSLLLLVLAAVVCGWYRFKPKWLYSWSSYSLLPVIGVSLLLLWLPQGLAWIAWPVYISFTIWLINYLANRSRSRDWLYVSLMLLPVPTIIAWMLVVQPGSAAPDYAFSKFGSFAPWVGLTFMAFAVGAAFFMRARRRWLKGSVLVVSGLLSLTMVIIYARGGLGLTAIIGLNVLMLALFLAPALIDRRAKQS
jgi:hypothetical protein